MANITPTQLVLLIILAVIQLTLMAVALTILFRTPAERLTAPRPVWILVCFVQFVGPITFLLLGRKPAVVEHAPPPAPGTSTDRVVDELYGNPNQR